MAETRLRGALTLAEAVGDDPTRALALQFLGTLTRGRGDLADAWNLGERAHDLHRKLGNRIGEGTSALILATVAEDRGDYEQACCLCARALAVFRELGHVWGTARSLSTLARSMRNGGRRGRCPATVRGSRTRSARRG